MIAKRLLLSAALALGCAIATPSPAFADDDAVTYEVIGDGISTANIKYWDGAADQSANGSTLPWRMDAKVGDLSNGAKAASHAEIHATWTGATPGKGVTVRISYQGKVICENAAEEGHAGCSFLNFFAQQGQEPTNY